MCRNSIWQLLASWLVAGSLVVLASCSLRPVPGLRLMKQSTQKCQEAAENLQGVQDAASAKAAAPRLEKLLIEIDQIGEKLERTYDPGDEAAINKELAEGIKQMQRLMIETARIGKDPAICEALGDVWKRLSVNNLLGVDPLGIEQGQ
jgi:hypothetical protein